MSRKVWLFLSVLVIGIITFSPILGFAAQKNQFSSAPPNPEFIKYQQALKEGKVQFMTPDGHGLGSIPPSIDFSYMRGMRIFDGHKAVPSSYDLRTHGKLTDVKDQGGCGSCWAFATFGSMESNMMPGEERDFSEYHLIKNAGWDWGICDGGNSIESTAYLARWSGPYNESDYPYPYYTEFDGAGSVQKHIQDVIWLPDRKSKTDNSTIKQAVMTYGGVYVSFQVDSSCWNADRSTYYSPSKVSNAGHAVTCVGWDDNFSKSKFSKTPNGNGAFLIKNSWGTGSGDNGYFYMSYYDFNLSVGSVFVTPSPTTNYSGFYQYDPLGDTDSFGAEGGKVYTAWGASIFKAISTTKPIKAISTYAAVPKTAYQIYLYNNVSSTTNPRTGSLIAQASGTISTAGYHTIKLPSIANITPGKKFSVVIKYTTPKYGYPIPVEDNWAGIWSKVNAKKGETFISLDGTKWYDMVDIAAKASVCIKAFTGQ